MTIGLLGVAFSLVLGVTLGGISGFLGGWPDAMIQRLIEFLQSLPSIPLWIGLAAAIPPTTPPVRTYFLITVILSVIGWTGLARVGPRPVPGAEERGLRARRPARWLRGWDASCCGTWCPASSATSSRSSLWRSQA